MLQNLRHEIPTFHVVNHMQFNSQKIPTADPAANAKLLAEEQAKFDSLGDDLCQNAPI